MNKRIRLLLIISVITFLLDFSTKQMASTYLKGPDGLLKVSPCEEQKRSCEKACPAPSEKRAKKALRGVDRCLVACMRQMNQCARADNKKRIRDLAKWRRNLQKLQDSGWCNEIVQISPIQLECHVFALEGKSTSPGRPGTPSEVSLYSGTRFILTYDLNTGAAWGILGNAPDWLRLPFFVIITLLSLGFVLFLFFRRVEDDQKLLMYSLAFIFGGALGNFYDRLAYGHVIDFLKVTIFSYRWPSFNIADVAISVGVALIAFELFFGKDPESGEESSQEATDSEASSPETSESKA